MKRKNNPYRLDANESAFFTRQLEHVKSRTYDTKYKLLKAKQLIPVDTESHPGATQVTFRRFTGVGFAKIIANWASDIPRVDVYGEEESAKVYSAAAAYGYSIKEIRASMMAGTNIDQKKANMARRAVEEKINDIAWNGDTDYNIDGFIDYPGITEYTVPNDGTGPSKEWATKTPDQIIRDLTGMINAIIDTTNGVEAPDTLLLPIEQYNYIANTRMTDGNDKTILTYFLENNPFIDTVEWLVELKGAGASSTDRMMVYTRDDEHLTLDIPQPFEQFPPQPRGLEFEIPTQEETAGVIVYYPLSIAYGDGI